MTNKNHYLDILTRVISDVGYWRWWTAELPNVFQIEFGGTQLLCTLPQTEKPPSAVIAISFEDIKSIAFLEFSNELPDSWIQEFHDDKINKFNVNHDLCSFNNIDMINELLNKSLNTTLFYGVPANNQNTKNARYKLSFAAGPVGLIVISDEMKIFSHEGEISYNKIEELNTKWWEYWKEYWKRKDTENPMPNDYVCEVTIPLKGSLD